AARASICLGCRIIGEWRVNEGVSGKTSLATTHLLTTPKENRHGQRHDGSGPVGRLLAARRARAQQVSQPRLLAGTQGLGPLALCPRRDQSMAGIAIAR